MFNLSDLSIALSWNEKAYTFSFKDTSLEYFLEKIELEN